MNAADKLFPLIVTDKLAETRAFYRDQAGFDLTIDRDGYLQVRAGSDAAAPELCFMSPTALGDVVLDAFAGRGLIVSIPTKSADRKAKEMKAAGASNVGEVLDKPWGWRSFMVPDPNGVVLDFFHPLAETAN
jgi:catechol 2,3-dioxygenase-like lactoylglutathione lyase family enzyme